jgi:hypothetical protein
MIWLGYTAQAYGLVDDAVYDQSMAHKDDVNASASTAAQARPN